MNTYLIELSDGARVYATAAEISDIHGANALIAHYRVARQTVDWMEDNPEILAVRLNPANGHHISEIRRMGSPWFLGDLVDNVLEWERKLARNDNFEGTHTFIYQHFVDRMKSLLGQDVTSADFQYDTEVPQYEGDWWLAAYAKLEQNPHYSHAQIEAFTAPEYD